jgi:hypothetical protein
MHTCFASLPREVLPIMSMHHLEAYARHKAMHVRDSCMMEVYNAVREALRFASYVPKYRAAVIMRQTAVVALGTRFDPSTKTYRVHSQGHIYGVIPTPRPTRYTVVVVDLPVGTKFSRAYGAPNDYIKYVMDPAWRAQSKPLAVRTVVIGRGTTNQVRDELEAVVNRTLDSCP